MSQWWNDDEVEGEPTPPKQPASSSAPPGPPPTPPSSSMPPGAVDSSTVNQPGAYPATPTAARNGVPIGVAIAAVLALIGGLLVYSSLAGDDSSEVVAQGEIFLERADEAGDDPFFDDFETLVSFDPSEVVPPGADLSGADTTAPAAATPPDPLTNAEILALTFKGGEPGLYGGTGNNATCNKAALIAFLETSPAKATAWAGAQGIPVSEIRPFVEGLTTVVLLADTRVTNHGFKNGVANPIQSVLQAGMAVMIDETGTPRVKCGCGNPLNRPIAQSRTVVLKGDPWAGFDQGAIATVEPAPAPVETFVLRSTDTGDAIERPAGTSGEADVLTSLSAPRPTDEVAVGAAAAAADSLTGSDEVIVADAASTTTTQPELSTTPETSVTAPPSTLAGITYCEKYQNYIVEGLDIFRDISPEEGSPEYIQIEQRWHEFLLSAIADLSRSSPPELVDDWQVASDIYGGSPAAGSFDLYSNNSTLAAAEDAIVNHGEDVCDLTF